MLEEDAQYPRSAYFVWRLTNAFIVGSAEAGLCKLVRLVYTEDLHSVDVDTELPSLYDGQNTKVIEQPQCVWGQVDGTTDYAWLWPDLEYFDARLESRGSELSQGHRCSESGNASTKYKDMIAMSRHD